MTENCYELFECAILGVCKVVASLVQHGFRDLDWLILHGNPTVPPGLISSCDTPVALKWLGGHPCFGLGKYWWNFIDMVACSCCGTNVRLVH